MKLITCSKQPGFNPWGVLEDIVEQSSEWTPNPHHWHSLLGVFTRQQVSLFFLWLKEQAAKSTSRWKGLCAKKERMLRIRCLQGSSNQFTWVPTELAPYTYYI